MLASNKAEEAKAHEESKVDEETKGGDDAGESTQGGAEEDSKEVVEIDDRVFPHPSDLWELEDTASVLKMERSFGSAAGIVGYMTRHPHNAKVQASCCRALAMLLNRGDAVRDGLEEAGAIEAVVVAMRNSFPASFYPSAFFVLSNMTNTMNLRRKCYVIHAGGMQEILNAIRTHSEDEKLVQQAFLALYNIARGHYKSLQSLEVMEGVSLVVDIMKLHPDNADVQLHACWILSDFVSIGASNTNPRYDCVRLQQCVRDAGALVRL